MISIIIPAHNEEAYLRRTLDATNRQHYRACEVIVVANGCTDDCAYHRANDRRAHCRTNNSPNDSAPNGDTDFDGYGVIFNSIWGEVEPRPFFR